MDYLCNLTTALSMKTWYIIPARKSSKGIKFKNRILFDHTAGTIPSHLAKDVLLSSDDEELLKRASEIGFQTSVRSPELANDHASMKDVLLNIISTSDIHKDDEIILLYLTYPQRTWSDIQKVYSFYQKQNARSVVCAEPVRDHPYLCLQKSNNHKAKQVVSHNLYRRQDYPDCFRYSLFVAIYKASEIQHLNDLLFCDDTSFYQLPQRSIDVDHVQDLIKMELMRNGG